MYRGRLLRRRIDSSVLQAQLNAEANIVIKLNMYAWMRRRTSLDGRQTDMIRYASSENQKSVSHAYHNNREKGVTRRGQRSTRNCQMLLVKGIRVITPSVYRESMANLVNQHLRRMHLKRRKRSRCLTRGYFKSALGPANRSALSPTESRYAIAPCMSNAGRRGLIRLHNAIEVDLQISRT